MIRSKKDYRNYLIADKEALGRKRRSPSLFDEVWKFEILLRKYEYLLNCKKSIIYKPYFFLIKYRFRKLGMKLGFIIPPNVFGYGLSIAHPGTIVINEHAQIGNNCRIHVCTNIGTQAGFDNRAPKIGNNVYIGPGAKLFGKITIADGIKIGANAVVNKTFLESNITIAGVPAKNVRSE